MPLVSRITSTDRAQSETVGIVLLLAVFVVSAGAVGVALVGDVTSDADEVVVSADLTADGTDLRVSHLGGDALPNDELTAVVRAEGNATRLAFAPPDGRFGPGDERTFPDALVANVTNEVRFVHEPSGEEIARVSLRPTPEPTAEPGAVEGTVVGSGAPSLVASGAAFGLRRSVAPVSGATVAVEGVGRVAETTTAAGGAYRIEGIEPGTYELSVSAAGFASASKSVTVRSNETTTADVTLDPLAPAEFAVRIDDVDARVDAGDPVVVNATVENVGDEQGTQRVELSAAGAVVDGEEITLAGGERRRVSLAWQTLPADAGEVELAVASEDDTATTTVEVLDAETDAVAYVDRDGDGSADETFTAAELAFLNELDGRFVVFEDAGVVGSVGVRADRVVVEEGVTLSATAIELVGTHGVSLGDGSTLDASSDRFVGASAGDVTVRSEGDVDARGVGVTTAARALFGVSAGDIDVSAAGDVDVREGAFDATGRSWFGFADGTIRIASDGGTVAATGAAFDPEPTIESDDE
ncbi:carboxypeptidase regulatory-like domain-containing protein [Halorubrum sp. LN27]|uniref:carboxypeptidase regulatory-like domain-containing protein n=1 Tax=Halorubrum sp. LN27 TaxID=2801032 RepID=UPI00190CE7A6|nr:carboxypeptidase regulatory-like domain-containing protein [Halorubrum sp. LN27]